MAKRDQGAPLRIAGVGAGFFAQFHYEAWQRLPRAELVGVCDSDLAKAERAAAQYGGTAYQDVDQMLRDVRPDIFDIATPPATHMAMVRLAAELGIDCICQKPVAPTLEAAREIVAVAEAAGITLVIHENFRFQPWYRKLRTLMGGDRIDRGQAGNDAAANANAGQRLDGMIGDVYQVTFRLRPGDGQGPSAYLDRQPYFQQMPRFLMHETGVHFIDVFRFLLGEPSAVYADLRRLNPAISGEDAGIVVFDLKNGGQAVFDGNRLASHAAENPRLTMGEMVVEGENGRLTVDGFGRIGWLPHGAVAAEEISYPWENRAFGGDCVYALQDHVIAHFLDGAALENTGRAYLRNIELVDTAYLSAQEGRKIPV